MITGGDMRRISIYAGTAWAVLTGCVGQNATPDNLRPATTKSAGSERASHGASKADPQLPVACEATVLATQQGTVATICRSKQVLLVDVDHDGTEDCLVWTRCGADAPGALKDGGISYPVDSLGLSASQGGGSWELYTNRDSPESDRLEEVTALRFGATDERVLTRATGYGTGNIQIWAVVDVFGGAPRRWLSPPLDASLNPLLEPGERIGKHYERGVEAQSGGIEVSWLVYRQGEPNCCPTGGVITVRLVRGDDGLRVGRAWRESGRR